MGTFVLPKFGSLAWRKLMLERKRRLKKRYPDGKVSVHFTYQEFACHDGSPIPIRALPGLENLCKDFLEPMRAKFGECYVLSGYRHRVYNTNVVHGAFNSVHIWDETPDTVAADLRFAKGTPAEWARMAKTLRAKHGNGGGVGLYPTLGFVHVDNRHYDADWAGT